MIVSTVNVLIGVIASHDKFFIFIILSLFLIRYLNRKFRKLTQNKVSKLEKYELLKNWISTSIIALKSLFADDATRFRSIINYLSDLRHTNTPSDIFLGFLHFVYIDKPDDFQIVLNNSNALQKSGAYRLLEKYIGKGLLIAPVDKWRRSKRLVSPFFSAKTVDNHFNLFYSHSSVFVEKMKKYSDTDEYIDLWEPVSKLTLQLIWEVALGTDYDLTEYEMERILNSTIKVLELFGRRLYSPWLYPTFMFELYIFLTGRSKLVNYADEMIKQIVANQKQKFEQKMEFMKEHGENSVTFSYCEQLHKLNKDGIQFTEEDVIHEALTIMIAGYETTAITICSILMMLAMHPKIQEKVYREIIKYSGDDDVDCQQVNKMVYLEQCIKETLRLFPPVPFIMRRATNSFQLNDDCTIQKNANIVIPIWMMHRDPSIYPNPLEWNPDNFEPDLVEGRHSYSYLAFSGGARGCIGGKYAMVEMKVVLSKFLKTYRIDTDQVMDDIKLKLDILVRSVNGYNIKLYSRIKT